MKKLNLIIVLTSCAMFVNAQTTSSSSEELLMINPSKSKIKWFGEYAFYFGGHDGKIDLKEGYFIKTNGSITGGLFVIDMNTIKSLDMDKEDARKDLDNHLKNEDFFEVNTYPTAKIEFTKVTYESDTQLKIFANLTIKNMTKPINFYADVDYKKELMTTKFKIDRTLWGITYNSKEIEGKLKDGLISDAIGFEVSLSL